MEERDQILEIVGSEDELEEYLEYLDELRESGVTNMFGAGAYIQEEYGLSRSDANKILTYWMNTFSERHQDE